MGLDLNLGWDLVWWLVVIHGKYTGWCGGLTTADLWMSATRCGRYSRSSRTSMTSPSSISKSSAVWLSTIRCPSKSRLPLATTTNPTHRMAEGSCPTRSAYAVLYKQRPPTPYLELVQLCGLLDLEEHLGAISSADFDVESVVCIRFGQF